LREGRLRDIKRTIPALMTSTRTRKATLRASRGRDARVSEKVLCQTTHRSFVVNEKPHSMRQGLLRAEKDERGFHAAHAD
jgi:hypothetical protein